MDENVQAASVNTDVNSSVDTSSAGGSGDNMLPNVSPDSHPNNDGLLQEGPLNQSNDVRLVEDENGERSVVFGNDTAPQKEAESPLSAAQSQQNADIKPYTDTELVSALQSNAVDPARITQSQQAQLQAVYQAQQQQAMIQQRQNQLLEENRKKQALDDRQAFKLMQDEARQEAMKQAGLTDEDLESLEYMDDTDERKANFEAARYQILMEKQENFYRQRFQQEQATREFVGNMAQLSQFCQNEAANEKEYQTILSRMDEDLMNMPMKDAIPLLTAQENIKAGRCTRSDLELFRQSYDATKRLVYQNKLGVSTIPKRTSAPRVEHGGTPNVEQTDFDPGTLRGLDQAGRDAAVQAWIRSQLI